MITLIYRYLIRDYTLHTNIINNYTWCIKYKVTAVLNQITKIFAYGFNANKRRQWGRIKALNYAIFYSKTTVLIIQEGVDRKITLEICLLTTKSHKNLHRTE